MFDLSILHCTERERDMRRFIGFLLVAVMTLGLCGCGTNEDSLSNESSDSKILATATTTTDNIISSEANSIVNDYSSAIENDSNLVIEQTEILSNLSGMKYLDEDDKFFLKTNTNPGQESINDYYIMDYEGNAEPLTATILKSKYYEEGYVNSITDILGNDYTDRFIKDKASEKILFCGKADNGYVIWVIHTEETPTSVDKEVIVYSDSGDELFRFDPEESGLDTMNSAIRIEYEGSNVFKLKCNSYTGATYQSGLCCNPYKQKLFWVSGFDKMSNDFSNGYAIDHLGRHENRLIDNEGNILYSNETNDIFKSNDLSMFNNGLFYDYETKIFYDKDLNKIIDLSDNDYKLYTNEHGRFFNDKIQLVSVRNENKTIFLGVLDNTGNWIVELQKLEDYGIAQKDSFNYENRVNNDVIILNVHSDYSSSQSGYYLYNMKTKEHTQLPVEYERGRNNYIIANETIFRGSQYHEIYKYNIDTFSEEELVVKVKK